MKLEQLLAKCPKCGSQDKTVQRKMLDDQKAHAEMKAVVCDECGYIFETKEDQEEKYKKKEKEEIKKESEDK